MTEPNEHREFDDSDSTVTFASIANRTVADATEEALKQSAERIIGQMSLDSSGKAKRVTKPITNKNVFEEAKPKSTRTKFVAKVVRLALHKKKDRALYEKIVNGSNTAKFIRSIKWGPFGKCYALLEWTEEVPVDASTKKTSK